MHTLATIGYESATVAGFLETLRGEGIELLVDVRAVASSRRPGFAKTRLSENLASVGIEYLHLRGLGTPAEGRAAARAGRHDELRRIYLEYLQSPQAQAEVETLLDLIRGGRRICVLCLEANPVHCHRSMLAAELASRTPLTIVDLFPNSDDVD